ncbi:MAG: NusG domain II-containing protein [Clostridia bacterium]|nr:NusG domain II-containing protein [Clostridia bacterium]
MPKRRDLLLIALVILVAAVMLGVSRLMPKTDLSSRTADVTLAPDAIEYVEATPSPEATGMPQLIVPAETAAPEETEAPKATQAPAQAPEVTEVPGQLIVPAETATPEAAEAPEATKAPAQEAAMVGPMPPKKAEKVRGYVVLTVGGRQYGDPIPMDRDKIITLKQDDGKINKVHITPETVYMEFSTCENQDCVGQGEVHVDTYKDRILGTYIICLPNNVSIEMVPAED